MFVMLKFRGIDGPVFFVAMTVTGVTPGAEEIVMIDGDATRTATCYVHVVGGRSFHIAGDAETVAQAIFNEVSKSIGGGGGPAVFPVSGSDLRALRKATRGQG